jgi:hypothetical protein
MPHLAVRKDRVDFSGQDRHVKNEGIHCELVWVFILTRVKLKLNFMARHPLTVVIVEGKSCSVEFAVRTNGSCPGREFFEGECKEIREGPKTKPESSAHDKFMLLFQQMSEHENLSPKRFKKEKGKFFAFSHEVKNIQIRFACFLDGSRWVITHGFCKPGSKKGLGKWPEAQNMRAEEIRDEYFIRKKQQKQ